MIKCYVLLLCKERGATMTSWLLKLRRSYFRGKKKTATTTEVKFTDSHEGWKCSHIMSYHHTFKHTYYIILYIYQQKAPGNTAVQIEWIWPSMIVINNAVYWRRHATGQAVVTTKLAIGKIISPSNHAPNCYNMYSVSSRIIPTHFIYPQTGGTSSLVKLLRFFG